MRQSIAMKILIFLSCVIFLSASAIEEDFDCNTLAINTNISQPINGKLEQLSSLEHITVILFCVCMQVEI